MLEILVTWFFAQASATSSDRVTELKSIVNACGVRKIW